MHACIRRSILASLALLIAPPLQDAAIAAPVSFVADDGTSDIALGNFSGGPADVLFVNQFDAGPGGATINEISYAFGTPLGATLPIALQVVLFDDADDDDSIDNANLLASVAHVPTQVDNDVFNAVPIAPTFVAGRFFVGVYAQAIANGQAIVGADSNDPPGATFSFIGSALDLDDVLGTADILSFDPDGTAIALIRAAGVTAEIPAPGAWSLLAFGLAALLLGSARRWANSARGDGRARELRASPPR